MNVERLMDHALRRVARRMLADVAPARWRSVVVVAAWDRTEALLELERIASELTPDHAAWLRDFAARMADDEVPVMVLHEDRQTDFEAIRVPS